MDNAKITFDKNNYNKNILTPAECMRWAVDKMMIKTSSILQALMYSENLEPEQLIDIHRTYLYERKMMSTIHNISILYDGGKLNTHFASYDVRHFLRSVVKYTHKLFRDSRIEFYIDCEKRSAYAVFDVKLMSFIIFNLISNSILHTKRREKTVNINASVKQNNFIISYKDNGSGISAAKRRTLFIPNNSVITREEIEESGGFMSVGLGLKASYKTAVDMGGSIECLPGKGAEFIITIPQKKDDIGFNEVCEADIDTDFALSLLAAPLLKEKFGEQG